MPTSEENKEFCRRFMEEVFGKKNVAFAESALSDDFVEHNPFPGLAHDKKGALQTFETMFAGSPDITYELHDLIASGDRVAIHSTFRGTDTGGQLGAPATNKPYELRGIDIVRVTDDGRFAEHWGIFDAMGLMMQLGLLPPPPSAAG